jgi:succinate-acetate transporter protein
MVFGGLLGLGGGLSFVRSIWIPGVFAMDGWWFLSAGIILVMLLLVVWKISRIMFAGMVVISVALVILGLAMIGVFGSPDVPMAIAGWMALVFAIFSWYQATAIMLVTVYGKKILPL